MAKIRDLRIIGGQFRGRKIKHPETEMVRPTKDRIREAVFNMVAGYVPGARVLDLFAGSGALGIEALSRTAKSVTFVDSSKVACGIIRKNLGLIDNPANTRILKDDVLSYLQSKKPKIQYDFIFADPPYNFEHNKYLLKIIRTHNILSPRGVLMLELRTTKSITNDNYFEIISSKSFGNTTIMLLKISGDDR